MATVTIEEAVSLSCDREPVRKPVHSFRAEIVYESDPVNREFERRLKIAVNHAQAGQLKHIQKGLNKTVAFWDFAEWAKNLGLTLPEEFPQIKIQLSPVSSNKWPWGSYETKLLVMTAKAAERFWKNYDPSQPDTAPTNEQVIEWLNDNNVPSGRTAGAIASILRADNLKTGPRKK